jgi:hypothetical protein
MGYRRFKEPFWFIVVLNVGGHDYLLPGGETEIKAREKAISVLKGESYELKPYYTRDLTEATRQYKHSKLMQTKDIWQSVKHVKHTTPDDKSKRTITPGKFARPVF